MTRGHPRVQGIGQALYEGVHYDGDTGQLLTGSLLDYARPARRRAAADPGAPPGDAVADQPPGREGHRRAADDRARGARRPRTVRSRSSRHAGDAGVDLAAIQAAPFSFVGISGSRGLGGGAVAVDRLSSVVALPEGVSAREAMLLLEVFARLKERRFGRLTLAMSDGKIVDVEVVEKIDHEVLRRLPM